MDIAQKAGVSRAAVSLALNGRPGLSAGTRERILSIAKDAGWYPSSAARALQGFAANACGLILARPAETLAFEPFFMELIAGIESELSAGLLLSPSSWWTSSRWTPSWNYIAGGEVSGVLTACSFSIYATRPRALMSLYGWVSRLLCWRARADNTRYPRSGRTKLLLLSVPSATWRRWGIAGSPGSPVLRVLSRPGTARRPT